MSVTFSASDAKNEFGQVLDAALEKGAVMITKHDAPKAVLLSLERFDALSKGTADDLDSLSAEFDELLARMQQPPAGKGMNRLFTASSTELGRAASFHTFSGSFDAGGKSS